MDTNVLRVDTASRQVILSDQTAEAHDQILIATGARAVSPFRVLKLKGLDPGARYQVDGAGCWGGDALMHAGFPLPAVKGDYQAVQLHLTAVIVFCLFQHIHA